MSALSSILSRRTIRLFKQIDVPNEALRDMIDAARVTSCAANMQILRYLVVKTPELVHKVFDETAWAALVKPHRSPAWGVSAPNAFIAVLAPADAKPITHADAGAAIQSMQITAFEKGLGCCWMGAINRANLHDILNLPENQQVLYVLAVGVPDEQPMEEDITDPTQVKYYLDGENRLHIPKLSVDTVAKWL